MVSLWWDDIGEKAKVSLIKIVPNIKDFTHNLGVFSFDEVAKV